MNRIYAGVGSRETPQNVLLWMRDFAFDMASHNVALRSGGAVGADLAFETGNDAIKGKKEIFVVPDYPGAFVRPDHIRATGCEHYIECLKIASRIHPNWHAMQSWGRAQHARNIMQVMGEDLNTPVDFLICWAPIVDGQVKGGTRTAWVMAKQQGIPCFNMAETDWTAIRQSVKSILKL